MLLALSKLVSLVIFNLGIATSKDLRKVVPNIKHAIMWSYEIWSELDAHIVRNCCRMVCIWRATWNVGFPLLIKWRRIECKKNQMNLVRWFQSCDWVMTRCQSILTFRWKGKRLLDWNWVLMSWSKLLWKLIMHKALILIFLSIFSRCNVFSRCKLILLHLQYSLVMLNVMHHYCSNS